MVLASGENTVVTIKNEVRKKMSIIKILNIVNFPVPEAKILYFIRYITRSRFTQNFKLSVDNGPFTYLYIN